nr:hypothetical protein BN444_02980 [Xanthomonas translucens pv. translucens DSM 18974]
MRQLKHSRLNAYTWTLAERARRCHASSPLPGFRGGARPLNGSILVRHRTSKAHRRSRCAIGDVRNDHPPGTDTRTRHVPGTRRADCHQHATRQPALRPSADVPLRHTLGIQSPLMRRRLSRIGTHAAQGRTLACQMPDTQAVARQGKRRMPQRIPHGMPAIGDAEVFYATSMRRHAHDCFSLSMQPFRSP